MTKSIVMAYKRVVTADTGALVTLLATVPVPSTVLAAQTLSAL